MADKQLVLYYQDAEYIRRFAAYVEKRSALPLKVKGFTDEEAFWEYVSQGCADLILIPEGSLQRKAEEKGLPFLALSERTGSPDPRQMPLYRRMDEQIKQLRASICWDRDAKEGKQTVSLIAFCSPVHGAGQSLSAILAGLELAELAPTLLINLERFSGLTQFLAPHGGSLSDLLYFGRVQGNPLLQLEAVTESYGPLSYIPPVRDPDDLRENSPEDWAFLLDALQSAGLYRYIVLDMGDGAVREKTILERCEKIYCPLRADPLSDAKWEEWKAYLIAQQEGELLERLRPYRLEEAPPRGWTEYREMRFHGWGRRIKALIREEA